MDRALFRPPPEVGSKGLPVMDDLVAYLCYRTDCSCSLDLYREDEPPISNLVGWVETHFPCDGLIPIRMRVSLPEPYSFANQTDQSLAGFEAKLQGFVEMTMHHLRIPKDLHFRAIFQLPDMQMVISSDVEREQYSHNASPGDMGT